MIDLKELDEKYILHYVPDLDKDDFSQELILIKKNQNQYVNNYISVSDAYKIAAQKKESFSAGDSLDIQSYMDVKALNDQLGFESDFLTHYLVARTIGRSEPFTKENTSIYGDDNLKKLNVMFGFEKYNPEDNLFGEKNEDPYNILMKDPSNFIGEFEFQRRNCERLHFEILKKENDVFFSAIKIGDEEVANCVIVDEGNGHYFINSLHFKLPELTSSKPYIEFYKIASARFMVSMILDFISSGKKCLKKSGLLSRIEMKTSLDRNQEPLTKQNICLSELNSMESIKKLIVSIELEETEKWFKSKDLTVKIDEYYPESISFSNINWSLDYEEKSNLESMHINRLIHTKIDKSDNEISFELKYEKIPDIWTEKETKLIMPKYYIQNSFHFPSFASTIIAKGAFKDFNDLEFIYVPETVKKIEDGAFENCPKLKTVLIEDGVEYTDAAFINCGGTKDFFAKTCLHYNFYNEQFTFDTGLASSIYIDVAGETEKRFGKLLIIAASDTDLERIGIPFTVEENPKIAVGSESDLQNWQEYFESNLEEKDIENIKDFIRKNLDLLKEVSKLPHKNGHPDFEKSNEMLKKLISLDGSEKKQKSTEVLSQAEIDNLLDF